MPGTHKVASPRIRCQRHSTSSIVVVSAWPTCSAPVTLGGGMMIVKGARSRSSLGWKAPLSSQSAYMRPSTLAGW